MGTCEDALSSAYYLRWPHYDDQVSTSLTLQPTAIPNFPMQVYFPTWLKHQSPSPSASEFSCGRSRGRFIMTLSPMPMLLLRQRHLSNPEVEHMENSPDQFPRPKRQSGAFVSMPPLRISPIGRCFPLFRTRYRGHSNSVSTHPDLPWMTADILLPIGC